MHLAGNALTVAVYPRSSVVHRLGGAFTLVVDSGTDVLRVEAVDARSRPAGDLAVIEGRVVEIRPTVEPPWQARLEFHPEDGACPEGHTAYWRALKGWLRSGAEADPPLFS